MGVLQEFAMHPAYNLYPDRKVGLALTFIVCGSIAGASGVVVQMAGHEPNIDSKSVIAAAPLSPSATLSTIVSPASRAVPVQFSASRIERCNYHSGGCAGCYVSDDRTTPAACCCFQEAAKNGTQPEPARSRRVRCLCVAPAA